MVNSLVWYITLSELITGGAVLQPCVNSHWLSQWEPFIFDSPPQNGHPLTVQTWQSSSDNVADVLLSAIVECIEKQLELLRRLATEH